jgi:hypothetical protein
MFRLRLCIRLRGLGHLTSTTLSVPAETAFPPGLRIGLDAPQDMKVSTRFPGFEDSERNAVIAILDLPASAYRDLENSAFGLTPQNLDQLKRESFPFESGIGFLISGTTQQNGVIVHRWSLLALAVGSVQNLTVLINVEVPEAAVSLYSDAVIRKALASVTFRPAAILVVGFGAERSDLKLLLILQHDDDAELPSDRNRARENTLNLIGQG